MQPTNQQSHLTSLGNIYDLSGTYHERARRVLIFTGVLSEGIEMEVVTCPKEIQ